MKAICFFLLFCLCICSCDSYLDQIPEEKLNEQNLFKLKNNAVRALTMVYDINLNPLDVVQELPGPLGEEVDWNFSNFMPYRFDMGDYGPSKPAMDIWGKFYKQIHRALFFLEHIDECDDPRLSEKEREQWKGEAHFLLAYFYFDLLRVYGPVPILDKVYSGTDLDEAVQNGIPRSTVEELITFIDRNLEEAISRLEPSYLNTAPDKHGRANASIAAFLRSRLWLYAASPMYNGMVNPVNNVDYSYLMLRDNNGKDLFSKAFDKAKWEKAVECAQNAIDIAEEGGHGIFMGDKNHPIGISAYKYPFETPRIGEPGIETIFTQTRSQSSGYWGSFTLPLSWAGYSGVCATLEHVNEYFTSKGLLPTDDADYMALSDNDFQTYDKDGFSNIRIWKKFMKRDPRFYANILFPERYSYAMITGSEESYDCKWCAEENNERVYFRPYYTGPDGFAGKTGRDYSSTGMQVIKYVSMNTSINRRIDGAVPYFRFTELYLNYIEAAFENDVANGRNPLDNDKIFEYWDRIRDRIALPHVKDAYENAGIPLTIEKLRELIRNERRVELAYEGHRLFDDIRWLEAERNGGEKHGFNIMEDANSGFWNVTPFETRVWKDEMYFFPIPQAEMDKNKALTQNW